MSPLQWSLLVLGAVVLVGVLVHNWWSARQLLPKQAHANAAPATHPADTAPTRDLDEPWLDDFHASPDPYAASASGAGVDSSSGRATTPDTPRPQRLDNRIDAMVPLELDTPLFGDAVLAAMPVTRRIGTKPFYVEGLDTETGVWELPSQGRRYSALRAGVQLANRTGPLNEIEFSEFVVKMQEVADTLQAEPHFPDMIQEVNKARELDQFASRHDAQLGFTLRAKRAAWSPGYLAQHAAKLGFVAGAIPGRLVLPGSVAGAAPILVLTYETQAALADDPSLAVLRVFHLTLDVLHVEREEQPFARLREVFVTLSVQMDGAMMDDAGHPLSAASFERIEVELDQLYTLMEQYDLPPGSPVCRRLFS